MNEPATPAGLEPAFAAAERVGAQIGRALVGQREVVRHVLMALLAGGHVLLEGVPGLGKTLLVRALAKTFGGTFARIQFTPDLMPSDVTGHALYDLKSQEFRVRRGPVFTHLLLADEINRAPAKTQAALLEVMQEGQVSIEGQSFELPRPFMVLATQNPIEQEGTYPLPEAQLDRFLLKVLIRYPEAGEEADLVRRVTSGQIGDALDVSSVDCVLTAAGLDSLRARVAETALDDRIVDYAVRLVRATREWPGIALGAGPRGSIALIRAARAAAVLAARDYVIPDDIKAVALPALRHRVALAPELDMEGKSGDEVLRALLERVDAPRH